MTKPPKSDAMATRGKKRIGDTFVDNGLLSKQQLKTALQQQTQSGGHLGSILIEMGFITIEALLDFLAEQSGFPAANLSEKPAYIWPRGRYTRMRAGGCIQGIGGCHTHKISVATTHGTLHALTPRAAGQRWACWGGWYAVCS